MLTGDALANTLNGFGGDDILTGGRGRDTLNGGNGSDNFIFGNGDSAAAFYNSITDFVSKLSKSTCRQLAAAWRLPPMPPSAWHPTTS